MNAPLVPRQKTIRVTPDIINDRRLGSLAVRAFLVLVDCRDGKTGFSTITIGQLAKRLFRTKKNAQLAVNELTQYGYVQNRNGQRVTGCYEFLSGIENDTRRNGAKDTTRHLSDGVDLPLNERRANQERLRELAAGITSKAVPA